MLFSGMSSSCHNIQLPAEVWDIPAEKMLYWRVMPSLKYKFREETTNIYCQNYYGFDALRFSPSCVVVVGYLYDITSLIYICFVVGVTPVAKTSLDKYHLNILTMYSARRHVSKLTEMLKKGKADKGFILGFDKYFMIFFDRLWS